MAKKWPTHSPPGQSDGFLVELPFRTQLFSISDGPLRSKDDTSTVGYGLPLHSPAWALSQRRGAKGKRKKIQILQFSLHALPGQCCQQAVITRKVVPDYKNKWQRKKYKWIDSMRHNWPMTRVLSQRLYLTKPRRVVKKKIVSIIYILITRYNDLGTRSHLGVYLCYTLYTCLLSTSRV